MAWQGIVSSQDVAKENKYQIVETEHLMKALLEQKNGLARRIFTGVGVDNSRLLEATVRFIQRQPKVIPICSSLSKDFGIILQDGIRNAILLLNHLTPDYQKLP